MSVEEYRKAAIDAVAQLSVDVGIPTKLEAIKMCIRDSSYFHQDKQGRDTIRRW